MKTCLSRLAEVIGFHFVGRVHQFRDACFGFEPRQRQMRRVRLSFTFDSDWFEGAIDIGSQSGEIGRSSYSAPDDPRVKFVREKAHAVELKV